MSDNKNCKLCGAKPEHQTKIQALQNIGEIYPSGRGLPMSEGPWVVIPSDKQPPYKFAVIGKDEKPVAFTHGKETSEAYAGQMNTQGYIEVY